MMDDDGCCPKPENTEVNTPEADSVSVNLIVGLAFLIALLILFSGLCYKKWCSESSAQNGENTPNSRGLLCRRNSNVGNGDNATGVRSDIFTVNDTHAAPSAPPANLSPTSITPPPSPSAPPANLSPTPMTPPPSYEDVMKERMKS